MSKLLRRSGNAVAQTCICIDWRPDIIWQIGVGVHHQEVDCLLETWEDIRIVGFEPHPKTYRDIKNKYPGELLNLAVGKYTGEATLYSKPRHKDGSSTRKHSNPDNNLHPIQVNQIILDCHYIKSLSNRLGQGRSLLWLDCEGSELDVLQSGERFLEGIQAVNIEMTGPSSGDDWATPIQLHTWFVGRGFYLQMIHTNRIMAGQYDALYVRKEIFSPDFTNCIPEAVRYLG